MARLLDRVAIITGASGGVGSATAKLFSREGAKLVLSGRNVERLHAVAATCDPERTIVVPSDNRDPDSLVQLVRATIDAYGALHVVIANAGIEGVMRPFLTIPLEAFDEMWQVNARGTVPLLQASLPWMMRARAGSIVVIGSMASVMSMPGIAAYAMTKTALLGLVRTLALEFARHKIRVNMVAPGGIENQMLDSVVAQLGMAQNDLTSRIPMRRMATNEEVANLALFFAGDESSYCTGTCLVADGGYQAG